MKINKPTIPELFKLKVVSAGSLISCAEFPKELLFVPNRNISGMDEIETEDNRTTLFNIETGDPRELSLDSTVVWYKTFNLKEYTGENKPKTIMSTAEKDRVVGNFVSRIRNSYQRNFSLSSAYRILEALIEEKKDLAQNLLRQDTGMTMNNTKHEINRFSNNIKEFKE